MGRTEVHDAQDGGSAGTGETVLRPLHRTPFGPGLSPDTVGDELDVMEVRLLRGSRRIGGTARAGDTSGPYVIDHLSVLPTPDRLEVVQQCPPACESVPGEEGDHGDNESHADMMAPRRDGVQGRATEVGQEDAALDQMPRRLRAELLRTLRLRADALDEEIRRWESDPHTQGWAETLRGLRDEPVARLTVREMLELNSTEPPTERLRGGEFDGNGNAGSRQVEGSPV